MEHTFDGLSFYNLDKWGNIQSQKVYDHPTDRYYLGEGDYLIKCADGGFFTTGTTYDALGKQKLFYAKFDSVGDSLFWKTPPFQELIAGACSIEATDGSFWITGVIRDSSNDDHDLFLMKTSPQGHPVFFNRFGSQYRDEIISSLYLCPDQGLLIAGNSQNDGKTLIFRTDSLGAIKWTTVYNQDIFAQAAIPVNNDEYILFGAKGYNQISSITDIFIARIRNKSKFVWKRKFGTLGGEDFILTPPEYLPDSGLIFTAKIVDFVNGTYPSLFKITLDGDSIFNRKFHSPSDYLNLTYGFAKCSDGGFIITGSDVGPTSQDSWVLKLDAFGCSRPGCALTPDTTPIPQPPPPFSLFPNPGADLIHFQGDLTPPINLTLFDLTGRKVEEHQFTQSPPDYIWTYPTEKLRPGLYLLLLRDASGFEKQLKWLKM
ncbi:MAG: T9SS type A sorting domain-containing protein [Bacteroidia bacterium]|nr:T9SS type A sorting domain-containing protein [Bacteroidia bacterium]